MVTMAEFAVAPEDVPLSVVFDAFPGARIELERVVPRRGAVVPYVWVDGVDPAALAPLLERELDVEAVLVETVDERSLVRLDWDRSRTADVVGIVTESDVSLIAAVGTAEGWRLRLRGDDHETVTELLERLRATGVSARPAAVETWRPGDDRRYGMTTAQREAVLLAYELGYFASPRETTLEAVATELGISRQALSSRLRRGLGHLVEHTVAT
jgi:predicted DNA binding protein